MSIRIYLENLKKYNIGHSVGTWLTLPMKIDELEYAIQCLLDGDEEWVITDFEAPFLIDRYDDIFAINEAAAVLAQHDSRLIYTLYGYTDNMEQVIRILRGGHYIVVQDVNSLRDVAMI